MAVYTLFFHKNHIFQDQVEHFLKKKQFSTSDVLKIFLFLLHYSGSI